MHSTNEISTALNNTYPPLSIESKQRILNSLIKANLSNLDLFSCANVLLLSLIIGLITLLLLLVLT
jgi:hypothetical protein